ncbi:MAG: hypothetical protein HFG80_03800 [Eubacterium sp.]|nr:hypothetical protein [Eubacterium sp.]
MTAKPSRIEKKEQLKSELLQFIHNHGGILKTADLNAFSVNYRQLQKLLEENFLKRVKNGYYTLGESGMTEEQLVAALYSDAVLCMDSALYYYHYIEEKPAVWHLAVDKNTSKARFKAEFPKVKPYYTESHVLESGVVPILVGGSEMKIYQKERLICDCVRYESHLEPKVLRQALSSYIKDEKKDIRSLNRFARERNVSNKVHNMIGVWLG